MVRVAGGAARHVPRDVPVEALLVEEDAHELGDDERRVRVVELDEHLVRQRVPAVVRLAEAAEDVPQRARDEEVLLAQAQLLALGRVVVRIQHLREVLGKHLLLDRLDVRALVEVREVEVVNGLRAPEAQRVDRLVVADDREVVWNALHRLGGDPVPLLPAVVAPALDVSAEMDVLRVLGARHLPRVAVLQPVVRLLDLAAVDDALAEDAVVVAESVAHSREVQRRHRVDVARGEASEAAVAEPRVRLVVAQVVPVDAVLLERVAAELVGLEVDDVVAEEASDKELERHVVDALRVLVRILLLRRYPALDETVADRIGKCGVPVAVGRPLVPLRERIPEVPGEVLLQSLHRHLDAAVLVLSLCLLFHLWSLVVGQRF